MGPLHLAPSYVSLFCCWMSFEIAKPRSQANVVLGLAQVSSQGQGLSSELLPKTWAMQIYTKIVSNHSPHLCLTPTQVKACYLKKINGYDYATRGSV